VRWLYAFSVRAWESEHDSVCSRVTSDICEREYESVQHTESHVKHDPSQGHTRASESPSAADIPHECPLCDGHSGEGLRMSPPRAKECGHDLRCFCHISTLSRRRQYRLHIPQLTTLRIQNAIASMTSDDLMQSRETSCTPMAARVRHGSEESIRSIYTVQKAELFNARRIQQFVGDGLDELAHQENAERAVDAGMIRASRCWSTRKPPSSSTRDDRDVERNHHHAEDADEEGVAPRKRCLAKT